MLLGLRDFRVLLQAPAPSFMEDPGPSQIEWEGPEGASSAQSAQTQHAAPQQAASTGKLSVQPLPLPAHASHGHQCSELLRDKQRHDSQRIVDMQLVVQPEKTTR